MVLTRICKEEKMFNYLNIAVLILQISFLPSLWSSSAVFRLLICISQNAAQFYYLFAPKVVLIKTLKDMKVLMSLKFCHHTVASLSKNRKKNFRHDTRHQKHENSLTTKFQIRNSFKVTSFLQLIHLLSMTLSCRR